MHRDEHVGPSGAQSCDLREDLELGIFRVDTGGPEVETDLANVARDGKLRLEGVEHVIERAELGRADPPGMQAEPKAHGLEAAEDGGEAFIFGGGDSVGEGRDARIEERMCECCRVICKACVHVHINEVGHGASNEYV